MYCLASLGVLGGGWFSAGHAPALIPWPAPVLLGVALEVEGGLHERDVAERLRHVADKPAVARIILFTEQPDVVTQGEQPFEQLGRFLVPAPQLQRVRQPEAARQEGSLRARQPVHLRRAAWRQLVPAQETALPQVPLEGLAGGH